MRGVHPVRWGAVGVLVLLLCAGAAGQLEPSVQLSVTPGFNNFVRDPWSPVTVVVTNRTGEEIRGELRFREDYHDREFKVRQDVYLAPEATKRIFLYIPGRVASFSTLTFVSGGKVLAEESIQVQRGFGGLDEFLVVVSPRPGILNFLETKPTAATRSRPSQLRTVAPVSDPTTLPDRWAGYSGVTTLILNAISFDELSAAQQQALLGWVQTGGRLVFSPGIEVGWLQRPPLSGLLKLQVGAGREVTDASELEDIYGKFEGQVKFEMRELRAPEALLEGPAVNGWPSYVGVRVGAGVVVVTAFDTGAYPFRGWLGAQPFWESLLDKLNWVPRPSWKPEVEQDPSFGREAQRALAWMSSTAVSVTAIVVLIAAYVVCVGPLNYLVLRNYRRRVWLVVTTPLVAVGFVLIVAGFGALARDNTSVVHELTFLTVCGDSPVAYQRTYLGVWCPGAGSFNLEGPRQAFIKPLATSAQDGKWNRIGAVSFAGRTVLEDALFRIELRCFQVDSIQSLGGRLQLHQGADGLVLYNGTDFDLRGAHTARGTQDGMILFGDVPSGEQRTGRAVGGGEAQGSFRVAWMRDMIVGQSGEPGGASARLGALVRLWDGLTTVRMPGTGTRSVTLNAAVEGLDQVVRVTRGRVRAEQRLVLLTAHVPVRVDE